MAIRRDELAAERRYRVLDPLHVKRAQEKVRQIVAGPLDGPSAAWEDEADPDYDAWMGEVTEEVLERTERGSRAPITLAEKDFTPWTIRHRQECFAEPPLAAGRDQFADLIAPPNADLTVSAGLLPWPGPGELRVVRVSAGVVVVFRAERPIESPPLEAALPPGGWALMVWDSSTDRTESQAFVPWKGEEVRLRIPACASTEEVVVRKP